MRFAKKPLAGRGRRLAGEIGARSLGALAAAYLIFWGCAWGTARAPYSPPSAPLPPTVGSASKSGATVGASLLTTAPQGAASGYASYRLSDTHEIFGGVGAGVGLTGLSVTPFGGLRLHFDVAENLRIGLEVSAAMEGGFYSGFLVGRSGAYLLPGLGVGMPLAWQMWEFDDGAGPPIVFTLYTDPAIFVGPAWGYAPTLSRRAVDRAGLVRLPVGVSVQLDAISFYAETGGQGMMGMSERAYLLPIPFPYFALGAGYSF
jgi:hypothetical protein